MSDGAFILNVGHVAEEIDMGWLYKHPHNKIMPFVEKFTLPDRNLYLLAGGSMLSLTAGFGDSINAFDVMLAVMVSGIKHITDNSLSHPIGCHFLPRCGNRRFSQQLVLKYSLTRLLSS